MEKTEEEEEDEEVIDGERLFDGVAGDVLYGGGVAQRAEDEECDCESGGDPDCGRDNGGAVGFVVGGLRGAATGKGQFADEQDEYEEVEADPVAKGGGWHVVLMMLSRPDLIGVRSRWKEFDDRFLSFDVG